METKVFGNRKSVILLVWRASLILAALPGRAPTQTVAQAHPPVETARTPAPAPPFYQRFREHKGNAVSMIYGVGEIGTPPTQAERRELHPLSLASLSCASPPRPEQMQPFSVYEWMDKSQAVDLGIIFRAPDGAERPFLGTDALVWRSGATATCPSADGTRTVVYGWEWDVGVVVQHTPSTRSAGTFRALQTHEPFATVLSFGESINGALEQRALLQPALSRLWTDWQSDLSGHLSQRFLEDFEDARTVSIASGQPAQASQAIGWFLER